MLAADVLYERRNGQLLLELLPQLVGAGGEVLVADPGRPHAKTFFAEADAEWLVEPVAEPVGSVELFRLARR